MITSRLGREEKKRLCSRCDREGTCEDTAFGGFTRHGYMVTVWRLPLSEQTSVHATLALAMSLILLEELDKNLMWIRQRDIRIPIGNRASKLLCRSM